MAIQSFCAFVMNESSDGHKEKFQPLADCRNRRVEGVNQKLYRSLLVQTPSTQMQFSINKKYTSERYNTPNMSIHSLAGYM